MWFFKSLIAQYAIYLSLAFPALLLVLIARRRWNSELANRVHTWRWAYVVLLAPTLLVWTLLLLERSGIKVGGGDTNTGFTAWGMLQILLLLVVGPTHLAALLLFVVQTSRSLRSK